MPDGSSSPLSLSLIHSNASLMYNPKGPTAVEIPNMLASSDTKVEYQTPCIVIYMP